MPHLYIVRGLPGSGKSTYSKTKLGHIKHHYEADMFFERDGRYEFTSALIGAAHDWCFGNVVKALFDGHDVVVSNTFTANWEMEKYLGLAAPMGDLRFTVIEMQTQFQNTHNVPQAALDRMKRRWEELPAEWLRGARIAVTRVTE